MRIAVCDDNRICRARVTDLLYDYCEQRRDREVSFSVFSEPEALLSAHRGKPFDIYILDIVMPGMNGIELGAAIRSDCDDAKIIYLTASEEYALESFRVRAFHYLIKPVEQDSLFSVLDETISSLSFRRDRSLIVKTRESSARVAFNSILYAELSRRAVTYHLTDGRTLESTSLRTTFTEAVKELLSDRRFALCGASLAVNMHHITMVEAEGIIFEGSQRVHMGKKACRELRAAWNDFWLSEEG